MSASAQRLSKLTQQHTNAANKGPQQMMGMSNPAQLGALNARRMAGGGGFMPPPGGVYQQQQQQQGAYGTPPPPVSPYQQQDESVYIPGQGVVPPIQSVLARLVALEEGGIGAEALNVIEANFEALRKENDEIRKTLADLHRFVTVVTADMYATHPKRGSSSEDLTTTSSSLRSDSMPTFINH